MQKEVAQSIMALALSFDGIIVKLYDQVKKIEDEKARKSFDLAVGNIMGCIAKERIFPIEQIFPELKSED